MLRMRLLAGMQDKVLTRECFCQQLGIFLGHELTCGEVKPYPEKVKTVLAMVEPPEKVAARSFLGFVGI